MEEMIISRARETDSPYIEEKLKKYMLDAEGATWDKFFVAKRGDKTVAFGRIVDHKDFFEIASLGVDYYHRHKGVGTEILLFLIEEARRLDSKRPVYLVTHRPGFFRKSGFSETEDPPAALEDKKRNKCTLPPSKIKIMELSHNSSKGKSGCR